MVSVQTIKHNGGIGMRWVAVAVAVVGAAMDAAVREGAAATREVAGEARLAPSQALPAHETLSPSQVPVM